MISLRDVTSSQDNRVAAVRDYIFLTQMYLDANSSRYHPKVADHLLLLRACVAWPRRIKSYRYFAIFLPCCMFADRKARQGTGH